jgi:transcription elongation factor Elf1
MEKEIKLTSTITCPVCGHVETEEMPTDACQYFYDCKGCDTVLKPKQVFGKMEWE